MSLGSFSLRPRVTSGVASRWRPVRRVLLATTALAPLGLVIPLALAPARANPQGGNVAAGGAAITSSGSTLTVRQTAEVHFMLGR